MRRIFVSPILCCALTSTSPDTLYFQVKMKAGEEGGTAFEGGWYGKSLERINEPRLPSFAKDTNAEVYRMLILPTWGNSIAVGVQRFGQIYTLSARRLNGQARFEVGKLVEAKDIELNAEDSKVLEVLLQNLKFFPVAIG